VSHRLTITHLHQGGLFNTEEFLGHILPDTGRRVIAVLDPRVEDPTKRMRHKFLMDNTIAANFAASADRDPVQVFFAVNGYGDALGGRKGENVVACRSFYLDIDCGSGKPYADAVAALTALAEFTLTLGLPTPVVVSSGVGLHVYWPMDADLSPTAWRTTATMLKAACARLGLHADPSRTADVASVLRPVGATHRKGAPRPVKVLQSAEQSPHEGFRGALESYLGIAAPAEMADLGPAPAYLAALGPVDNTDLGERPAYPPAYADWIADRCGVMGMIRATGGVTDQGTWFHGLQLLARCEDGADYAHEWSKGDPRYTAVEVDRTLERLAGVGPTSCAKFREFQPAICGACPHAGAIIGPIALGGASAPEVGVVAPTSPFGEVTPLLAAPLANIETSRLSNLLGGTSYKRPFELGEWLILGELTVLGAPGAAGKTTLEVAMALSLASGTNILDLEVYRARTVLFLNYEEIIQELTLKFEAAARHHNISRTAMEKIHLYGSDTVSDATMTVVDPQTRQPRVNLAWFAWLRRMIIETGAEVVFLDPYTALMLQGMNDNGLTYAVVRAVKAVAAECSCAIVIAAHTRKGAAVEGEGAEGVMGAAGLTNGARVALGVRRLDEATARVIGAGYGEEGDYREVVNQKANFTPLGGRKFFRFVGVPMNNAIPPYSRGDWVAVAESYTPKLGARSLPLAAMKDAAIQIARGSAGGAEPYCQKKLAGGRWFGDDVMAAIKPHMPDLTPKALEAAAKELVVEGLSKGWIVARPFKNAHRKTASGLAVVWSATEWAHDPLPPGTYLA